MEGRCQEHESPCFSGESVKNLNGLNRNTHLIHQDGILKEGNSSVKGINGMSLSAYLFLSVAGKTPYFFKVDGLID